MPLSQLAPFAANLLFVPFPVLATNGDPSAGSACLFDELALFGRALSSGLVTLNVTVTIVLAVAHAPEIPPLRLAVQPLDFGASLTLPETFAAQVPVEMLVMAVPLVLLTASLVKTDLQAAAPAVGRR